MSKSRSLEWIFWVAIAAGFALRMVDMCSTAYMFNADHAIVQLMAAKVPHADVDLYFWGQTYGGTILSLVTGVAMLALGDSPVVLTVVSAMFWAGAAVLTRYIVEVAGGARAKVAGVAAGIIFWFFGQQMLFLSVSDPGFYGPSLVIGLGTILLVIATPAGGRRWWIWALIGLLVGLAWWTSPAAFALAMPALVWALIQDWGLDHLLIGVAAGIVGAVPYLVARARWDDAGDSLFDLTNANFDNVGLFFTRLMPAALPGGEDKLIGLALAAVGFAAIVYLFVRGIRDRSPGIVLLGVGAVLNILIVASRTPEELDIGRVRYLAFILAPLAVGIALWVSRWTWATVTAGVTAIAMTVAAIVAQPGFALEKPSPYDADIMTIARQLEAEGVPGAYVSYWSSTSLTAVSHGAVQGISLEPRRTNASEHKLAGRTPMVFVVYVGQPNDEALSEDLPVRYTSRTVVGGYAVYHFDRWFDPFQYAWDNL